MNILIGDDHLLFREGLCRLLSQMDAKARFLEAGTFTELYELAHTQQHFDVILMDLQMPGFSGFSGIQSICLTQQKTPVIIISASESLHDVRAAFEAGVSGYIPKSSSVKLMLAALQLVFAGGIYIPPIILSRPPASPALTAAVAPTLPSAPDDHPPSHTAESFDTDAVSHIGLPKPDPATLSNLTQRQRDVLMRLREGKSNRDIALELGLSEGTVKIHITGLMRNLGVRNRTQAVIAANDLLA